MKKTMIWVMAGLLVMSILPAQGFGQTAKEVLEKMIEAQGGRKAMESRQGHDHLRDDGTDPAGHERHVDHVSEGAQHDADGHRESWAWSSPRPLTARRPGSSTRRPAPRKRCPRTWPRSSSARPWAMTSILNPEKYGITYELKGKEKVGDKDCLVLEQTMSDGHKTTFYVDPATYSWP